VPKPGKFRPAPWRCGRDDPVSLNPFLQDSVEGRPIGFCTRRGRASQARITTRLIGGGLVRRDGCFEDPVHRGLDPLRSVRAEVEARSIGPNKNVGAVLFRWEDPAPVDTESGDDGAAQSTSFSLGPSDSSRRVGAAFPINGEPP